MPCQPIVLSTVHYPRSTARRRSAMKLTSFATLLALCALVGALGGLISWIFGAMSLPTGLLVGVAYALIFAVLAGPRATSPGSGLLWALGTMVLFWLLGPAGIFALLAGDDLR